MTRPTSSWGSYELGDLLYTGADTTVLRARDTRGRAVTLKRSRSTPTRAREAGRLRHEHAVLEHLGPQPGIVELIGLDEHDGTLGLVLGDPGASSLDALLSRARSLPVRRAVELTLQLATTLDGIHRLGVVHKDLKPQNILVDEGVSRAWLIDFGIASRLAFEATAPSIPETLEGTLAYISPEQTGRTARALDARTDLYSLGVTLYQLLSGRLPFTAHEPLALVHAHLAQPPPPLGPEVPPIVRAIVERLLAKDPERRYQTARGLAFDLRRVLDGEERFTLAERDFSPRLQLPNVLVGRETASEALRAAFDRAAQGAVELVLVGGPSGIGKTALVRSVYRRIAAHGGGVLLGGKHDQLARSVPYAALSQAFAQLMGEIAASPAPVFERWRSRLLERIGTPIRALQDLVPELEWVVGRQPELERGTAEAASNRLRLAWLDLVDVTRDHSPPLVLFLDDVQWADLASWTILKAILTAPAQQHLLVIAAFRDNEAPEDHPLWRLVEEVRATGVRSTKIDVGPLDPSMVERWLAFTLDLDAPRTAPLASVLHAKTAGNPYFLGQLLLDMHRRRSLVRDPETGAWGWELDAIANAAATDNVVELMSSQVASLPEATQSLLGHVACAGHVVSLHEAAVLTGLPVADVARDLWPALAAGLLSPIDGAYREAQALAQSGAADGIDAHYRFAHDRVQQACHARIPPDLRARVHWAVGQRLRARFDAHGGSDRDLLELVRHLGLGASTISDRAELIELARLDLRAARAAKNNSVFALQASLVESAQAIVGERGWSECAELCVELELERLEASFLLRELDVLHERVEVFLARPLPATARLAAQELRVRAYAADGRFADSARAAMSALEEHGIRYPAVDETTIPTAVQGFVALDAWLESHPEGFADFRHETSPMRVLLEALQVEAGVGLAFSGTPELAPVCLFMLLDRINESRAVTVVSAYAISAIAQVRSALLGTYRSSMRWAMEGLAVATRVGSPFWPECSAYVGVYTAYERHVEHCRAHYRAGMRAAALSGLFQGYSWNAMSELLFVDGWSGRPLPLVRERVRESREGVLKRGDATAAVGVQIVAATIDLLEAPLQGAPTEEDGWLGACASSALAGSHTQMAAQARTAEAHLFLVLGAPERALKRAEEAEATRASLYGTPSVTDVPLWLGLAAAQCWSSASPDEERTRLGHLLDHAIDRFRYFTEGCAENFGHKLRLLEAERARLDGRLADALVAYDDAIEQARANGFLHVEALAAQLAVAFHEAAGRRRLAASYLAQAIDAYERWGAFRVVHHLKKTYFDLLPLGPSMPAAVEETLARTVTNPALRSDTTVAATRTVDTLDVDVALRSAQALSGEVTSSAVLARLMQLVLESAGAQRAALSLDTKEGLRWVARLDVADAERVRTGLSITVGSEPGPASTAAELVARTRQVLLVADTRRDPRFGDLAAARGARSVLASPLMRQGRLVGVLVLEHGEPHAFTEGRVSLVNVLASQAAIALENAKLYDELRALNDGLEATVALRTSELQKALSELWGEMDLATKVQTVLLPEGGRYSDLEIAAMMRPADNVGGDYYDVVELGGRTWVMIGDVSGHGISAGLVMMMVQTAIRTALHVLTSAGGPCTPSRVLTLVNAAVWPNLSRIGKGQYMTLAALCVDGGRVTHAGLHLDLLVYRAHARHVERVETDGLYIGVVEDVAGVMRDQTFTLDEGDTLLLWTDGLSEARGRDGALLGQEAVEAWLAEHAGAPTCQAVLDAVLRRLGDARTTDDVTLLALRRQTRPAPGA
ncbi:AAA family ATPase [Myxococcota bacterium]|nr:AAA family ATPase [Myxococcota bacterium]